jgi:aldehyde:ferredoxin oxidoreductase
MFGFHNQILIVDATEQSSHVEHVPDHILEANLGGKGLATHLLLDRNPPNVDPLAPENHFIIAAGPVAGSAVWGSCRHGIFTKSPLTGFYSESYSGGSVADFFAVSGYDAVIIRGAAPGPVWIEVTNQGAVFHDARYLWGLDTYATEDRVKTWIKENRSEAKGCGAMVIGPAGENRVAFAVVENDYWRSAGRTGVGAVMGSKNIKAVAFWGDAKKQFADSRLIARFVKDLSVSAREDKGVLNYKSSGTPMLVDIMHTVGGFPTRYWRKGRADHHERINAPALHAQCDVKPNACRKCFIACGRLATVRHGRHTGLTVEGPEYETIYAFGGICEVTDIKEIAYLNDVCDRLGIDTITAGNLAGLAIEASRQGKIEFQIDYDQIDRIAQLLGLIAHRQDVGAVLADGIRPAAAAWDMEDQAVHVKGMEPAGYDPRILKGMGLAYGTSDRGACHLRATFYKPELSHMIPPDQIVDKAAMFAEWEDRLTIFDSLVLCRFYRDLYQWESLATIIKGVTGLDPDVEAMRAIATRVTDNTRRFNLREGLTAADDRLPKRFHTEPLPETDKVITEEDMEHLLADYYQARGWDRDGIPGPG